MEIVKTFNKIKEIINIKIRTVINIMLRKGKIKFIIKVSTVWYLE